MKYVDRGDASFDFADPIVADGTNRDLDLSGIIPAAGANHMVLLLIELTDSINLGGYIRFREKGTTLNGNVDYVYPQTNHVDQYYPIWVKCDANRKISYTSPAAGVADTINICVRGWMED